MFSNWVTLFDPVRIDELLVGDDNTRYRPWCLDVCLKDPGRITTSETSLPMMISQDLSPIIPREESRINPQTYKDLSNLRETIKSHIRLRDYRLVEKADFVIAYRPYWRRTKSRAQPSEGVRTEVSYAQGRGIRTFIFAPKEDRSPKDTKGGPFAWMHQEMTHVLQSLDEIKIEIEKRWKKVNSKSKMLYGWATWGK